jgi:hypothetical protein
MEKDDLARTRQEIQKAQEPVRRMADIQKQLKDQETKRAQLTKEIERVQTNHETLLTQRRRLGVLLRALAEHPHEDVVILKIDVNSANGEPGIHGVSLRPQLADQLARTLTPLMLPLGWHVEQPKYKARNVLTNGGPWSFEMAFRPVEPEKVLPDPNKPNLTQGGN